MDMRDMPTPRGGRMTFEDAQTIAHIIGQADNGDPVTVGNLVDAFNHAVSDYVWTETGHTEYDEEHNPIGAVVSVQPAERELPDRWSRLFARFTTQPIDNPPATGG